MSDLEVEAAGSGLVHIIANSEPAAALLRMFCSPDDPPTVGRGGRQFILLARGNLEPIREVSIHDEELATRRCSMMRIMAR